MITIKLEAPILPAGAFVHAEIGTNSVAKDLANLKKVVSGVFAEADRSANSTPAERSLSERLGAIEKAIIDSLPPEARLAIANERAGL